MKSRLVARGDLSALFTRSFLVTSIATSGKLKIRSGDLGHGYSQGEKLSRPLLLRQPDVCLPDDAGKFDDNLLALVPIYGSRDAGRGLWRRIGQVLLSIGMKVSCVYGALCSYSVNGIGMILTATHVDDVIWASEPEFETIVQEMQRVLEFGTLEEYTLRFCGVEMKQDLGTFAMAITCSNTSAKLTQARLSKERSQQLDDALNDAEREQFQPMVGSLMWLCRCCRPTI